MGFIVILYLLSSNLDKVISMYNLICLDPKNNYKKKWKNMNRARFFKTFWNAKLSWVELVLGLNGKLQ
jgi:hypothetical protein